MNRSLTETTLRGAIAISFVTLALACDHAPTETTSPASNAEVSSPGRWVKVQAASDPALLEVPARVVGPASSSGVVAAPLRAKVIAVHVAVGQRVEKGAPIVDVVIPELLHAAASAISAEERLAATEKRLAELGKLKAEGLLRTETLFELEAKKAELSAERTLARATLGSAGLGALDAREVVARSAITLRSPTRGIVSSLSAVLGEVREAGGAPFARITGEGVGRVEAQLVRALPSAKRVELVTAAQEHVLLAPKPVAEVIDPDDGARTAWFELAEPKPIPNGLRGRLVITPETSTALEVPAEAIRERDGKTFVLRRNGTEGAAVAVVVIARSGATALVESTLTLGDEVLAASGEGER